MNQKLCITLNQQRKKLYFKTNIMNQHAKLLFKELILHTYIAAVYMIRYRFAVTSERRIEISD
jgi:hypothetical protein